jgi:hypothetical protein
MGFHTKDIAFLAAASQHNVDFGRTLMIGRHQYLGTARGLRASLREAGIYVGQNEAIAMVEQGQGYCEPVLHRLGARLIDSLDASDYEGATLVHDLNKPLPPSLRAKYSVVTDGGTLEHVFNFPVALAGALECVALGGHYVAVTPMNNWAGHGFYQFSPELYFRVLCAENGFAIRCMLCRDHPLRWWYEVADPAETARRVQRFGVGRALLYIVAQRSELRDVLAEYPQQSDFQQSWTATERRRAKEAARRAVPLIAEESDRPQRTLSSIYKEFPPVELPHVVAKTWRWLRWSGLPAKIVRLIRAQRRDFKRVTLRNLTLRDTNQP